MTYGNCVNLLSLLMAYGNNPTVGKKQIDHSRVPVMTPA